MVMAIIQKWQFFHSKVKMREISYDYLFRKIGTNYFRDIQSNRVIYGLSTNVIFLVSVTDCFPIPFVVGKKFESLRRKTP